MSVWAKFRERVADSAIDFALEGFWTALFGALVSASAITGYWVWSWWKGVTVPLHWWTLGAGALGAFVVMLVVTGGLVWSKRRKRVAKPVGRRGFLDHKADGIKAIVDIGKSVAQISAEQNKVTAVVVRGATKLTRAGDDAEAIRQAARWAARQLTGPVTKMSIHVDRFVAQTDAFKENFDAWIRWAEDTGQISTIAPLVLPVSTLRTSLSGMLVNVTAFRNSCEGARSASADIDLAFGQLVAVLDRIITKSKQTEAFCGDVVDRLGATSVED